MSKHWAHIIGALIVSSVAGCTPPPVSDGGQQDGSVSGDGASAADGVTPDTLVLDVADASDSGSPTSEASVEDANAGADAGADADANADVNADVNADANADAPTVCSDRDGDGIADNLEPGDSDSDGTPDALDTDSDGDGFADALEAVGNYPGATMRPALVCGALADDCDSDGRPNARDLDSDNDGLTDVEERMANTNACRADSDGDAVNDLIERVAGSNPNDRSSVPPSTERYVTAPYVAPGTMRPPSLFRLEFQTRIRAADVMFVLDTTSAYNQSIQTFQANLRATIVPAIVSVFGLSGTVRFGLAGQGDFGSGGPSNDGAVRVFQPMTSNVTALVAASASLRPDRGGDAPQAQVAAMFALVDGYGRPAFEGTAIRPANPATDCVTMAGDPPSFGWACFQEKRVPFVVLLSSGPWHNGPGGTNPYTPPETTATFDALRAAMLRRGALFVGIDVAADCGGAAPMLTNTRALATATNTVDRAGQPIALCGPAAALSTNIVQAITTVANETPQDVTTVTLPDTTEMRLSPGRTTAQFVRTVRPNGSIPAAPMGHVRSDATTFYGTAPSARVVFEADFFNDFQPGGATAARYRVTIVAVGRSGAELDRREVFVVVPASAAQLAL